MEVNILVVDDEKAIRDTLKGILEEEGYRVFTAESIKSMKVLVEKSYFHCVLLDLWLPDGRRGIISMYVDEEGRLSYFSIVGEEVSEALNLISFTMNNALWDDQLFRMPYTHPSLCEYFGDIALDYSVNRV